MIGEAAEEYYRIFGEKSCGRQNWQIGRTDKSRVWRNGEVRQKALGKQGEHSEESL